jgi:hypothetical protein
MRPLRRIEMLILGRTGMLGHKMLLGLQKHFPESYCANRRSIYQGF